MLQDNVVEQTPQPALPLDLERVIVEISARDILFTVTAGNCCLQLQLTARRFRAWIMPFIFRVLYSKNILSYLRSSSTGFFNQLELYGKYTTHILLKDVMFTDDDGVSLAGFLNSCPNLRDLALWQPRRDFTCQVPLHNALDAGLPKLRRLSTSYYALVNIIKILPDSFLKITHLDLFSTQDWKILSRFRNLTHLCINTSCISHDTALQKLVDPEHSLIQVIVSLDGPYDDRFFADPRYVYLSEVDDYVEEDWLQGANGGMDFWEFASRIVTCRQKGYLINSSPRGIQPDEFNKRLQEELNEEGQMWWAKQNKYLVFE